MYTCTINATRRARCGIVKTREDGYARFLRVTSVIRRAARLLVREFAAAREQLRGAKPQAKAPEIAYNVCYTQLKAPAIFGRAILFRKFAARAVADLVTVIDKYRSDYNGYCHSSEDVCAHPEKRVVLGADLS